MFHRKGFVFGVLAAVALAAVAGCGGSGASGGDSLITFVNAVPGGASFDAYIDTALAKSNVTPLSFTGTTQVPSGTRAIRITPTGNTATTLLSTNNPVNDATYSYVVYGTTNALQTLVLQDDTTGVNNNRVRVTVVHAAPGAGNVDVYVTAPAADLTTATPILTNFAPGNYNTLGTIDSGLYRVRVTPTGTKNVVIDSGTTGVTLAPGGVYNIYATQAGTIAAPAAPFVQIVK